METATSSTVPIEELHAAFNEVSFGIDVQGRPLVKRNDNQLLSTRSRKLPQNHYKCITHAQWRHRVQIVQCANSPKSRNYSKWRAKYKVVPSEEGNPVLMETNSNGVGRICTHELDCFYAIYLEHSSLEGSVTVRTLHEAVTASYCNIPLKLVKVYYSIVVESKHGLGPCSTSEEGQPPLNNKAPKKSCCRGNSVVTHLLATRPSSEEGRPPYSDEATHSPPTDEATRTPLGDKVSQPPTTNEARTKSCGRGDNGVRVPLATCLLIGSKYMWREKYPMVNFGEIDCPICNHYQERVLNFFEESFYTDYLSGSRKEPWWPTEAVCTFAMLCWHDNHPGNKGTVVFVLTSGETSTSLKLTEETNVIIHVANIGGHFAIVRLVLAEKIAYIYEGKGWNVLRWKIDVDKIVKMCNLAPFEIRQGPILFQQEETDDSSCGPIACANLMYMLAGQGTARLISMLGLASNFTKHDMMNLRLTVVTEFLRLQDKHRDILFKIQSKRWIKKHLPPTAGSNTDQLT
jgi:hypothetical protein